MENQITSLRILHTSDWHLGKRLHDYDRTAEYESFRTALMESIARTRPGILLVAGDVFDTVTPTIEAEKFLGRTLNEIRRTYPDLHIVITSGNHDSGRKIESISIYMESCARLKIVGEFPVSYSGENGKICEPVYEKLAYPVYAADQRLLAVVAAVPFLTPTTVAGLSMNRDSGDSDVSYETGVRNIYQGCLSYIRKNWPETAAGKIPVIAMGHFYVRDSALGDDNDGKGNALGGEDQVGTGIFDGYDYVALGHIHFRQNLAGSARIRYSGSPIPVNFGEIAYRNGVDLVELAPQEHKDGGPAFSVSVTSDVYKRAVEFIRIPRGTGSGSEDTVLAGLNALRGLSGPYPAGLPFLSVFAAYDPGHTSYKSIGEYRIFLDQELRKLSGVKARICQFKVELRDSGCSEGSQNDLDFQSLDDVMNPMQLAARMYRDVNKGKEMPEDVRKLLSEIIAEAQGIREAAPNAK